MRRDHASEAERAVSLGNGNHAPEALLLRDQWEQIEAAREKKWITRRRRARWMRRGFQVARLRKLFAGCSCFLPGIISRVKVLDLPRADAVKLDDGFSVGPGKMFHAGGPVGRTCPRASPEWRTYRIYHPYRS